MRNAILARCQSLALLAMLVLAPLPLGGAGPLGSEAPTQDDGTDPAGTADAGREHVAALLGMSPEALDDLRSQVGGDVVASLAAIKAAQAHGDPDILLATVHAVVPVLQESFAGMPAATAEPCDVSHDADADGYDDVRSDAPVLGALGFALRSMETADETQAGVTGTPLGVTLSLRSSAWQASHGGVAGICIGGLTGDDHDQTGKDHRFGVGGIFIDPAGDDVYHADDASFGTLGGIFIDLGGDDEYHAGDGSFGTAGGLFIDVDGNDRYQAEQQSMGHGRDGDQGELERTSQKAAPEGASLRGTFIDLAGDDVYASGEGSFGTAGGLFIDGAGHDEYLGGGSSFAVSAPAYGSNGIPPLSTFIDREGDDIYRVLIESPDTAAFGFGNALFLDTAGDDSYGVASDTSSDIHAFGSSAMGEVQTLPWWSGVGAFIDAAGDDGYSSTGDDETAFGQPSGGFFLDGGGTGDRNDHGVAGGTVFFPQSDSDGADLDALPTFQRDGFAAAIAWQSAAPGTDILVPDADGLIHGTVMARDHGSGAWEPCDGCEVEITMYPGAVTDDGAVIPDAPGPEWSASSPSATVTLDSEGEGAFSIDSADLPVFQAMGSDMPLGNAYYVEMVSTPGGAANHVAAKAFLMDLGMYAEVDALDSGEAPFYARGVSHMSPVFVMHGASSGQGPGVDDVNDALAGVVSSPGCIAELYADTGTRYERGPIGIEGDAELDGVAAVYNDVCTGPDGYDHHIAPMAIHPDGTSIDPEQLDEAQVELLRIEGTTRSLLITGVEFLGTASGPPTIVLDDADSITFEDVSFDQTLQSVDSADLSIEDSTFGSVEATGADGVTIADSTFEDAFGDTLVSIQGAGDVQLDGVEIDGDLVIDGATSVTLDDVQADSVTITGSQTVDITDLQADQLTIQGGDVTIKDSDLGGAGKALDATGVASLTVEDSIFTGSGDTAIHVRSTGDVALDAVEADSDADCIDVDGTTILLSDIETDCTGGTVLTGDDVTIQGGMLSSSGSQGPVADIVATTTATVDDVEVLGGTRSLAMESPSWTVQDSLLSGASEAIIEAGQGDGTVQRNHLRADVPALEAAGTTPSTPYDVVFHDNAVLSRTPFASGNNDPFDDHFTLDLATAPTQGTNIILGPTLGGNHWAAVNDLWDGDGDGIAQQSHTPAGTDATDTAPLVTPNHAPGQASIIPDQPLTGPWSIVLPGTTFNVSASAFDLDGDPLVFTWTLPDGSQATGPQVDGVVLPSTGIHSVSVRATDPAGAFSERRIDLFVDQANQAPVVTEVSAMACDGSEGPMLSGTDICLQATMDDPDAGRIDRSDAVVLDFDMDGIADPDDISVTLIRFPVTSLPGPLGAVAPQPLLPTNGGIATSQGTVYIDTDGDAMVSTGDINLGWAPGHTVRPTDSEVGHALVPTPCALTFFDEDGDLERGSDEAVVLDVDCDGTVSRGDLDLATLSGTMLAPGTALTTTTANIGVWDRNGAAELQWSISVGSDFYQEKGLDARFTPTAPGPAVAVAAASDRGVPALRTLDQTAFIVASSDAPEPVADIAPAEVDGDTINIYRGLTAQLHDVTVLPPFTKAVEVRWSLDGTLLGTGSPLAYQPGEDDIGSHTLTLEVLLDTGRSGSTDIPLEIRPQPPQPVMEWTPATGVVAHETVTFTGVGSRDQGSPLTPLGATMDAIHSNVTGTDFLDVDGDGAISTGDVPLQDGGMDFAAFAPPTFDTGALVPVPTAPVVCFDDLDGDGNASADEPWSLADACDVFAAGDLLLKGERRGQRIDALAPEAVRPDASTADARMARLDDRLFLDMDASGNTTTGDLDLHSGTVLDDPEPRPFDRNATLVEGLWWLDRSGDGVRDAGGLYAHLDNVTLRLEAWFDPIHAFTPMPTYHTVFGTGTPTDTYHVCGSDTAADGEPEAFDFGEPAFLSTGDCAAIGPADIRLQPGQDLRTGFSRPAGTFVGEEGEEVDLPAYRADGRFALFLDGHLAHDVDADGVLGSGDLRISRVDGREPASVVLGPSTADAGGPLTFSWTCELGCGPGAVDLTDPDADGILEHVFSTSGIKEMSLTVTDSAGSSSLETRRLSVENMAPTARIVTSPDEPTDVDLVTLDARTSKDPDGGIASYTWLFDDGSAPQVGPVIQKRFDEPGLYRVTLLVQDGDVTAPEVDMQTILLDVVNARPQLSYSFSPAEPTSLESITLDASASRDLDGAIESIRWTIEDAGTINLTGPIVTYAFQTPGTKSITLTATDDRGEHSVETFTIDVRNLPPEAVADIVSVGDDGKTQRTAAISGSPPFSVQLSGSRSDDPDGAIQSYTWRLDGETIGSAKTITHEFTQRGVFEVFLEVTDADDASSTASVLVNVLNQAPTPAIVAPTKILVGEAATFRGVATDPEGDDLTYTWDFGGTTLTGDEVSHTFTETGAQEVRLTVSDSRGGQTLVRKTVVVSSLPPSVDLSLSATQIARGEALTVTGSAIDTDGAGVIDSHFIDFGDGHTVFASTATHTYDEPGSYRVVYRATEANGAAASKAMDVTVINPPPVIHSIDVTNTTARVGDLLLFSADVTDDQPGSLSYRWDFKDGVVSARQTPTHVYQVPASFTVELVVTDGYGAVAKQTIRVDVIATQSGDAGDEVDEQGGTDTAEKANDVTRLDQESPGIGWVALAVALVVFAARRRR